MVFIKLENAGRFLFVLSLIMAALTGITSGLLGLSIFNLSTANWVSWTMLFLLIVGIFIGLTAIEPSDIIPFLVASVTLIVMSAVAFQQINQILPAFGTVIENILDLIAVIVSPITVILSIKAIFVLASKANIKKKSAVKK